MAAQPHPVNFSTGIIDFEEKKQLAVKSSYLIDFVDSWQFNSFFFFFCRGWGWVYSKYSYYILFVIRSKIHYWSTASVKHRIIKWLVNTIGWKRKITNVLPRFVSFFLKLIASKSQVNTLPVKKLKAYIINISLWSFIAGFGSLFSCPVL